MAGKKILAITDRQYALLRLLWEYGPLTVRELMVKLPDGDVQPYTTILGMLQNMEKVKLVTHEKEGVTYRYRPAADEQETTSKLLRDFVGRFFGGSAERLVMGLVDADELGVAELRELQSQLTQLDSKEKSSEKRNRRSSQN